MMLPAVATDAGMLVADPDTGEMLPVTDAPDRVLAAAANEIARIDKQTFEIKRALGSELRRRHGIGTSHTGGYQFTITESQSWPLKATSDALDQLAREGLIGEGDVLRCMPERPKPDARQLKALIGRLTVSSPDAARRLAEACTISPPSVKDVREESVDGDAE